MGKRVATMGTDERDQVLVDLTYVCIEAGFAVVLLATLGAKVGLACSMVFLDEVLSERTLLVVHHCKALTTTDHIPVMLFKVKRKVHLGRHFLVAQWAPD